MNAGVSIDVRVSARCVDVDASLPQPSLPHRAVLGCASETLGAAPLLVAGYTGAKSTCMITGADHGSGFWFLRLGTAKVFWSVQPAGVQTLARFNSYGLSINSTVEFTMK